MGTRHLICIKKDGRNRVAQYGQWDGYPSGQGVEILKFLRNKIKVEELKHKIEKTRFIEKEGRDKKFIEDYNKACPEWSSDPDNRTEEQKRWAKTFLSRDVGSDILDNIISSEDKEILLQEDDGGWCEWFYTIDLDKMNLFASGHGHNKVFDINDLPDDEDFKRELGDADDDE